MQIEINGEKREMPDHISLRELIERLSFTPERLAVELNREVVRRVEWEMVKLNEGDKLEIVHFVGGG